MDLCCAFCLSPFSIKYKPYNFGCSHNFCLKCIKTLQNYRCPPSCPLDNTRLDDSSLNQNIQMLNLIKTLCSVHMLQYTMGCENHKILLCDDCRSFHKICQIFDGNPKDFSNAADVIIQAAYSKSKNIIKLAHKSIAENSEDGLIWLKSDYDDQKWLIENNLHLKDNKRCKDIYKQIVEENNLILSTLNEKSDNQTDNLSSSYKNAEILDETEVGEFIVEFFDSSIEISEFNTSYTAYLENLSEFDWVVNGVAIGTPTKSSGSAQIKEIIIFNEDAITIQNIKIEWAECRKTKLILLPSPVILKNNSKILMHISMEGCDCFMFENPIYSKEFRITDENERLYEKAFPVLFINCNYL